MPARKPARSRLALEGLEERSLLSASVLQTNLVSDLPGVAQVTDPNLVNPWGISQGPGPLWISDNYSGVSTIYNGQGQTVNPVNPAGSPLIVSIPTPGDPTGHSGTPDGTVFNPTFLAQNPGFMISDGMNSAPAIFLFATEDGTIVGWNPGVNPYGSDPAKAGTFGTIAVDNSGNNFTSPNPYEQTGAVYKGLTLATDDSGRTLLYAANFRSGKIDIFDTSFNPVTLPEGAFADNYMPKGYAPFNVEQLGGKIYVTYALQDAAKHDSMPGHGRGFVDVYNLDGSGGQRLISRGALDSPWGLAIAPESFGSLAGALLVGNFGDGRIHAFDATTGAAMGDHHGALVDSDGEPIRIDGLWALRVGNGSAGTDTNTIYFTAGLDHEKHGLFGSLTSVYQASPQGPAEPQALVAAIDVVQSEIATLRMDIKGSTIPQDIKTLNTDLASLRATEKHFSEDSRNDQSMIPSHGQKPDAVRDVIFADLDGPMWDQA
jgi:uncharacterized protein (TIGR03118 family)